jgi:hypothetical protein
MVHADASGRFEFRQVPPGWFRAMASKPGYAPDEARPTIGAQQTRPADVALRLTPWASISGRVVNEFGAPVQRARVQVMAPQFVEGRRVLAFASSVDPLTDDRGVYRVYGLEPGTYVVSAELADGRSGGRTDYRRSYFGSAGPTDATLLTVEAGQEVGDVDVRLVRSAAYRVTGRVLDATGQPGFRGAVAMLPRQRDAAVVSVPVSAQVDGDGRFEFRDITDGEYVVQAYRGRVTSTTEGEFGAVGVTVSGGDVTGVALTTRGGSSVSGEVVFDTLDPSTERRATGRGRALVPTGASLLAGSAGRVG